MYLFVPFTWEMQSLCVTMKKHPLSLKLNGRLKDKNAEVTNEAVTLYHGKYILNMTKTLLLLSSNCILKLYDDKL